MSVDIHKAVRERYGDIAESGQSCCADGCCGGGSSNTLKVPEGADLGLSCGNPTGLAEIAPGETVVDLGSGGGVDCFLASRKTGETGRVIGIDMTPKMIDLARKNAEEGAYTNVEFRLGEIEHLPVENGEADLIISNCVINLSPDKDQTFAEAYRALKPGGRMVVSDLVLSKPLSADLRENMELLTGCIAGAMVQSEYIEAMVNAGFDDVEIQDESTYVTEGHLEGLARESNISMEDAAEIAGAVRSITVRAVKQ